MKIVVLDGYCENPGDLSWNTLQNLGDTVIYDRTEYDDKIIAQRIGNAEAVYTNKTPISKCVIDQAPNLKFIGILATGYDIVNVKAAINKNIVVTNVPAYGTNSVAQMAIALLLEICHHVGIHNQAVQSGEWEHNADWSFWKYPLIELAGKKLGIIGLGRIGQQTARIAKALGMEVLANDAFESDVGRSVAKYVDRDTLFFESDIIILHCPLLYDTKGIINKKNIDKMKDGVIIINNSRGSLIIEADLAKALKSGKVRAAALDVVSTEPIKKGNPLLGIDNCLITPHISWAPKEARRRLMDIAVDNLQKFINGERQNVVK
ncbi:D-2-hydroxyacid dehydrogenase [Megasphaera paucivorans]|uniref:Glycerate dehydrogenase n=1 Tax=Megasphaera paucivorans TaxID=349095 RepID=A0A1H0ALE2_9FIRM|nr:D-2-hydroxyacid dehydrogenase [Megasphaera paucivorans]SDN34219.1 glycerate dehydrogenase [Megasphaera paucivorans]